MKIRTWSQHNEGIFSYFKDKKKRRLDFESKKNEIEEFVSDQVLIFQDDKYLVRYFINTTSGHKSVEINVIVFLKDIKVTTQNNIIQTAKITGTLRSRQKDFTYMTDIIDHLISNFERNGYSLKNYGFGGPKYSEGGWAQSSGMNSLTHIYITFDKKL